MSDTDTFEQAVLDGLGKLGEGQRLQQRELAAVHTEVSTLRADMERVAAQAAAAEQKADRAVTLATAAASTSESQAVQLGRLVGWPIPIIVTLSASTFVIVLIDTVLAAFAFAVMLGRESILPSTAQLIIFGLEVFNGF